MVLYIILRYPIYSKTSQGANGRHKIWQEGDNHPPPLQQPPLLPLLCRELHMIPHNFNMIKSTYFDDRHIKHAWCKIYKSKVKCLLTTTLYMNAIVYHNGLTWFILKCQKVARCHNRIHKLPRRWRSSTSALAAPTTALAFTRLVHDPTSF